LLLKGSMRTKLVWLALLLPFGCSDGPPPLLERGETADLSGSCAKADGDVSPDGCFCDDDCYVLGDCCSDKVALLGQDLHLTTYNVGLVDAVGMVEQRRQPLVDALAADPSDVLCLQEVWSEDDAKRLIDGLSEVYPFSFYEVTESDDSEWFSCTLDILDLLSLNSCVSDHCSDISLFECIGDPCKSAYDELDKECQLCLAANADSPFLCATWKAATVANEGHNGLLLMSRMPIEDPVYTDLGAQLLNRGLITATVKDFQVQCTHMSTDIPWLPFPDGHEVDSWVAEHRMQIDKIRDVAGSEQCTILMGDLNAGPASEGVSGELEENFAAFAEEGYLEGEWESPPCTHCAENPLVGGEHSVRLDHVMLKNDCPAYEIDYQRVYDEPLSIVNEGRPLESRLSDHYGVKATLSILPFADK